MACLGLILNKPFLLAILKRDETLNFHVTNSEKQSGARQLAFIQCREADFALHGKWLCAAKSGNCCKAAHPTDGICGGWQKTGRTDCWWVQVASTTELKFGVGPVGVGSLLSASEGRYNAITVYLENSQRISLLRALHPQVWRNGVLCWFVWLFFFLITF